MVQNLNCKKTGIESKTGISRESEIAIKQGLRANRTHMDEAVLIFGTNFLYCHQKIFLLPRVIFSFRFQTFRDRIHQESFSNIKFLYSGIWIQNF